MGGDINQTVDKLKKYRELTEEESK